MIGEVLGTYDCVLRFTEDTGSYWATDGILGRY